jgi:hypothetical protein
MHACLPLTPARWHRLLEVPPDLPHSWLVAARPEGPRCVVVAARGGTVARTRNGRVLARFASGLPAGSRATADGADSFCILDCVLHEARATHAHTDTHRRTHARTVPFLLLSTTD